MMASLEQAFAQARQHRRDQQGPSEQFKRAQRALAAQEIKANKAHAHLEELEEQHRALTSQLQEAQEEARIQHAATQRAEEELAAAAQAVEEARPPTLAERFRQGMEERYGVAVHSGPPEVTQFLNDSVTLLAELAGVDLTQPASPQRDAAAPASQGKGKGKIRADDSWRKKDLP